MFSYGTCPAGPLRVAPRPADALTTAPFGEVPVTRDHTVPADDDGAVFLLTSEVSSVLSLAEEIYNRERAQADAVRAGRPAVGAVRPRRLPRRPRRRPDADPPRPPPHPPGRDRGVAGNSSPTPTLTALDRGSYLTVSSRPPPCWRIRLGVQDAALSRR
ncbi:MAG TPA: hypothetical protein VJ276_16260 [Thermoanaerobaculia bacterium]|nr:hypothetical protein [Thermoanaerobaculia bacterium]